MKRASALLAVAAITLSGALLTGPAISAAAAQSPESHQGTANGNSLEQQILAKEREGLEALKAGDLERFGNLTADEAVLVDARGPASKAAVLKNVAGFRLTDFAMEDVRFVAVAPNTGLISYLITEKGISHGKEFSAQAYVSSLWIERGNRWVCLFSQESAKR